MERRPLPALIAQDVKEIATFGELTSYWEHVSEPLSKAKARVLVDEAERLQGVGELPAVPANSSLEWLQMLPLKNRTLNMLRRSSLFPNARPIKAKELLALSHFGFTSLMDLMCVLETAGPPSTLVETPEVIEGATLAATPDLLRKELLPILAMAMSFEGSTTLQEALSSPRLGEYLSATAALGGTPDRVYLADSLRGDEGLVGRLWDVVTQLVEETDQDHLEIYMLRRIDGSKTLAVLGDERGVSRERIRQIESRLATRLESAAGDLARATARLVSADFPPIARSSEIRDRIAGLVDRSSTTSELESASTERAQIVAGHLIVDALQYEFDEDLAISVEGQQLIESFEQDVSEATDDVGIVDLDAVEQQMPSDALPFVEDLVKRLGLARVAGHLALRDTLRVHVKAAVLKIGRPATKEEIAGLVDAEKLSASRVSATLSNIESIGRADKERWGLREWIDDEYEGIPAEIQQRIDANGGAVSLAFLIEDIPQRFSVSEASVRAYVGTPQFALSDGMVSVADESSITYRQLDEVAERNAQGEVQWEFPFEDRYLDGYSLPAFPPELARELGCGPNDRSEAVVTSPSGCRPVSIYWRLSSTVSGANIGYLSEPFTKLNLQEGDNARIVLEAGGTVRFERCDEEGSHEDQTSSASDILERLKNRRRIG